MRSFPKTDWWSKRNCWVLSRMTSFPRNENRQEKTQFLEGKSPGFTYVELKSGKSPLQQEVRGLTLGKKFFETLESNSDSLKSPLKSMGISVGCQAGFSRCLSSAFMLRWFIRSERGMTRWLETLRSFSSPSLKNCLVFLIFAEGDICQLPHYSSTMLLQGPERLCKQGMILLHSSAPACWRILSSVAGLLTPLMLMQDAEFKVETGSPRMTHNMSKLWSGLRWLQHQTKAHKSFSFRSIPAEYTWK